MIAHPGSPGAYALRLYQPGDDAALIDITRVAIREIGTARYSKDQVDAWAARHEARCQFAQRAPQTGPSSSWPCPVQVRLLLTLCWKSIALATAISTCCIAIPTTRAMALPMRC